MPDTSTPVVVIRCSRHGGLGITRSLGRMGAPVYHVDESSIAPAFYSRYSRGRFTWDVEARPPADTIAFLREVAARIPASPGRRPILLPTSDSAAMLVAANSAILSNWFDFPRVDPDLVTALCSKRSMYYLARRHGVPTPQAVFPECNRVLLEYSKMMQYPVMVKGIFGAGLERKSGVRMRVFHNRRQLLDFSQRHEDWTRPNLMLQEFIPGASENSWICNGYFNSNSEPAVLFTGRKLRQYPAYSGLASLAECSSNETVAAITRAFVKACGYRGLLDIDYIYDERDGKYKVLDINPRIGASFRLFVDQKGLDVARAMYLDITGQPVESAAPPDGRRWFVEDCDLMSSLRYLRDGKLGFREWMKSYRGVAEAGIFALDDPLPAIWTAVRHLQTLWRRTFTAS